MKEKKDCKECGVPLKNWQVKQGYDLCLECYKSKKTSHELLQDKSTEEEGDIEEKNEHKRKETRDEKEEEIEENNKEK